jgi:hypothetical protein
MAAAGASGVYLQGFGSAVSQACPADLWPFRQAYGWVVPTLHATGVDREEEENTRWKAAEGLVSGRQDYRLLITCVCPANYPGHPAEFAV